MEETFSKEEVVNEIINKVEYLGFEIEKAYVEGFIENFQKKYERLPSKDEIKPIVLSYMKVIKEDQNKKISEVKETTKISEEQSLEDLMTPVIKKFKKKVDIVDSLQRAPTFVSQEGILTIPKPAGRRLCPICGDVNRYNIHETMDKTQILCDYPRIYGKKYSCDQCGVVWKEQ